ncbi:BlaI/MecI/CopY family transcriptional regulator, partial [Candidatus Latescibacterota bacterium]
YDETLKMKRRTFQAVQTMLDRLIVKGYLVRKKLGPIWVYEPAVPRKAVVGREIDTFVATVLDKTFTPLFVHLSEQEKLSAKELAALRKLIEMHKDDAIEGKGDH